MSRKLIESVLKWIKNNKETLLNLFFVVYIIIILFRPIASLSELENIIKFDSVSIYEKVSLLNQKTGLTFLWLIVSLQVISFYFNRRR